MKFPQQSSSNAQRRQKQGSPYSNSSSRSVHKVDITLTGWNGMDDKELIRFLSEKAASKVVITSVRPDGPRTLLTVENYGQATAVKKLSGIYFNREKLFIDILKPTPSSSTMSSRKDQQMSSPPRPSAVDVIRNVILNRYVGAQKFLNLNQINSDSMMIAGGLEAGFSTVSASGKGVASKARVSKVGEVICIVIGEVCPEVETLTLDSNGITTLSPFSSLYTYAKKLKNLSLADNPINSYDELRYLHGKQMKSLCEIRLVNTSLQKREVVVKGGDVRYIANVRAHFPSLKVLDGEPLLEEIKFGDEVKVEEKKKPVAKVPLPVKSSWIDSNETAVTVKEFVEKYFAIFDSNRSALHDMYSTESIFSYSANIDDARLNTKAPTRGRLIEGGPGTSQHPKANDSIAKWNAHSRNHKIETDPVKRVENLFAGNSAIINLFTKLPKTEHPVTDLSKFMVDAFQQGGVMIILVHGEFNEPDINYKRSFDRNFIISPANEVSKNAGFPYTILQDQLMIRRWARGAWVDATLQSVPGTVCTSPAEVDFAMNSPNGVPPPPLLQPEFPQLPDANILLALKAELNLSDMNHAMVLEFAKATGLNYQFSKMCLDQTNWDPNFAMETFQKARPSIPPEAFRL